MKKAIIATSNHWNSPFKVGSYHIARTLASKGWEVAYISDPISPFHLLSNNKEDLFKRFKLYISGGQSVADRIWAYVPASLITPNNQPILRSQYVAKYWHVFTFPKIKNLIERNGFLDIDLLLIDSPLQAFLLDIINYKKAFLRIVDRNDGFKKYTNAIKYLELKISKQVDAIIYTAQSLKTYVEALNPKEMIFVPNGVDFNHFKFANKNLPDEYHYLPRPRIIYVGAMDFWFDYELLNFLARELPNVSFILIGPNKLAKDKLTLSNNIHLLGARSYNELPAYLYNADIGIIPFNVREHCKLVDNIHPLKLYEYMSCGLPVVSIKWREIENIESPAILCKDRNEFLKEIKNIIAYSTYCDKKKLIDYASKQDWGKRIEFLTNF